MQTPCGITSNSNEAEFRKTLHHSGQGCRELRHRRAYAEHTQCLQWCRIKGATATAEDRLPLSDADLAAVLPNFAVDPVAYAIFVTLADTGARLGKSQD